ncbi:MAG: MBL fold metallo-hydrolase, partial [Acidimicrobiales bacterium]
MPDLLGLSARIIDQGRAEEPVNRVTQELSEVADGVAVVESFSHCVALRTEAGLVVFDASGPATGRAVVESLRRWSTDPVDTVVYTHGHLDHVGGSAAFVSDAAGAGQRRPTFIGHENVAARFARYRLTDGWNLAINRRQFGSGRNPDLGLGSTGPGGAGPGGAGPGGAGPGGAGPGGAGPGGGRPRFLPDDVAA